MQPITDIEQRNKKIIEMFQENPLKNNVVLLSKQFGITKSRIWILFTENGINTKEVSKKAREKRNKEIGKYYESGVGLDEIAEMYEMNESSVKNIVNAYIKDKKKKAGKKTQAQLMAEMVDKVRKDPSKYSIKELSLEYNVSTFVIENNINKAGIPLSDLKKFIREDGDTTTPLNEKNKDMLLFILSNKGVFTIREMSEMFDISNSHLTRLLLHEGIMVSKKQVTSAKREALIEDVSKNPGVYTMKDLSEKHGVGYLTVSKWLEKEDLKQLLSSFN